MNTKPDIVERADQQLANCERIDDHEKRARELKSVFDKLNAFLKENPSTEHREHIENRKRSYLRSHLLKLASVKEPDRETWIFNFVLFKTSKQMVEDVLAEREDLRAWYDRFVESQREWWTTEIVPYLERSLAKGKEASR